MQITLGPDKRWYRPCPSCGNIQSYLRKNYAEESLRANKRCKGCANKQGENCHKGSTRGIRVSWFNKFKTGAETRGIEWALTIDDVADVYEKQEQQCALTGQSIVFPLFGHPNTAAASIDRINSDLGYTRDNIQLVTKHINMMKQAYTQEHFIAMCKAVAKKFS